LGRFTLQRVEGRSNPSILQRGSSFWLKCLRGHIIRANPYGKKALSKNRFQSSALTKERLVLPKRPAKISRLTLSDWNGKCRKEEINIYYSSH
jgi:hypothetical protein